jgi:hypothetical protein
MKLTTEQCLTAGIRGMVTRSGFVAKRAAVEALFFVVFETTPGLAVWMKPERLAYVSCNALLSLRELLMPGTLSY